MEQIHIELAKVTRKTHTAEPVQYHYYCGTLYSPQCRENMHTTIYRNVIAIIMIQHSKCGGYHVFSLFFSTRHRPSTTSLSLWLLNFQFGHGKLRVVHAQIQCTRFFVLCKCRKPVKHLIISEIIIIFATLFILWPLLLALAIALAYQKRCEHCGLCVRVFSFFSLAKEMGILVGILAGDVLLSFLFYKSTIGILCYRNLRSLPQFSLCVCVSFTFSLWLLCVLQRNVLLSFLVSKLVQICYGTQTSTQKRVNVKYHKQISTKYTAYTHAHTHKAKYILYSVQLIVNSHCNHKQIQIVPPCLFLSPSLTVNFFCFQLIFYCFVSLRFVSFILLLYAIASIQES